MMNDLKIVTFVRSNVKDAQYLKFCASNCIVSFATGRNPGKLYTNKLSTHL